MQSARLLTGSFFLLGSMLVAAQAFDHPTADRREMLMIFFDMRQSTPVLDLERPAVVHKTDALQQVAKNHLIPDLHGVEVYALGVNASERLVHYWQTLRGFWIGYFELAAATVESYSILRQIPRRRRRNVCRFEVSFAVRTGRHV